MQSTANIFSLRHAVRAGILLGCLIASSPALAGDDVSVSTNDGYGRILLNLAPLAHAKATAAGGVFTIAFDRKVSVDPAQIAQTLSGYISNGRIDSDGRTLRFALSQNVRLHTSTMGTKIAIDLLPQNFAGTPPDLPAPPPPPPKAVDVAALEGLKVRAGAYSHFTRIVFDWPRDVAYAVFPGAGKLTVRFEAQARPDLSSIEKFQPPWIKNAGWHIDGRGTVIEFETDSDAGYHDFRDGTHVVIDVLAPKSDAASYDPPGGAKQAPTMFASLESPVKPAQTAPAQTAQTPSARASKPAAPLSPPTSKPAAITGAQAKAIADAAAKINPPKPAAPPATPATQPPSPASKTASQPPAQATGAAPAAANTAAAPQATAPAADSAANGPVQSATTQATKTGIVLTLNGAGARPVAVFMRGLTAWIVLEGAPGFDATKLKSALGTFPTGVEAASGDGVSILRIGLKSPAEISARAEGSYLKVVIASEIGETPTAIGFSRNQEDPKLASLSTLLPGADRSFAMLDPVTGDTITVIPATAGRAMIAPHSYVEFALLKTAAGLVVTPFIDDLDVEVMNARVSITHPGGLALTPPAEPVPNSPSALTRNGDGPSFLDFSSWSKADGKTFLDKERRLRQASAHMKPEDATRARLALARFYLANGFAAEALGLINLMQEGDAALQSDRHLQTMRAAADYMMGRYKDAHNDIAATAFDTDRHAAFWRGLIETALENWDDARTALANAEPVMKRYPADWQARARIAEAETGLGKGSLEMADAALMHLPREMPQPQAIDAELARARLYAAEGRYRAAAPLFDAVQQSGDEHQAAEAIFYQTDAALAAGAIRPVTAIAQFERLRFRWRGDSLELKTLRRLGALYFAAHDWRKGLATLRIATQNFPSNETARQAQDDMRAAFVNLFLKGQADKMAPIEALSLFYDNVDLTPIGPQGDEMIRRMADRLVAVDLFSPAEDLLNYQVTKRLDGVARAQVATRLAMLYLMDKKPKQALSSLRSTQLSTLPDDVNHQRMLLEARSLAALKQWDVALDLISVDTAPDTARLRADIYWESGNWAVAGQKTEELLGARYSDATPLNAEERANVMRTAIAYSLANDQPSLDRLRDHFADKMKSSPDASAFAVVTQRIDLHGLAFRDTAGQIASIDTLQTFMKDFRKRYDGAPVTN